MATRPGLASPVWNSHGRKQPPPKPQPVPKSPRRFLFDGCSMTGFVDPSSSTSFPSGALCSGRSSLRQESKRKGQRQGAVRRTYLDGIDRFSFSPGPTYDTSFLRHNPGPSPPQYSWFHESATLSPSKTKPRIQLKPATPGHTSKFPSPTMVDWSKSTVSRNRANAIAAIERPIESRSGLRKLNTRKLRKHRHNSSAPKFLHQRKRTGRLRPRPTLPWGNPMRELPPEPSVMPYRVRFHNHDDRCSSLGGNFFEKHLEESEESEVFCEAVTELEAHIQLRRANIWRTLRPKGMDLLNFPKLFYEQ